MTTPAAKTPAVSVGSAVGPAAPQALEEVLALTRRLRMPYLRQAAVDVRGRNVGIPPKCCGYSYSRR